MEDIRQEIGLEQAARDGIMRQESDSSTDDMKEKVNMSEPTKV